MYDSVIVYIMYIIHCCMLDSTLCKASYRPDVTTMDIIVKIVMMHSYAIP